MAREIAIQLTVPLEESAENQIRLWVEAAAELAVGDICIRVMSTEESRALNKTYRDVDRATNVLAFPSDTELILGDLAICSELVAVEAEEQNKTYSNHFAHLVVHGVLHLRGFDHATSREAQEMEAKEVEILQTLGIENPYE